MRRVAILSLLVVFAIPFVACTEEDSGETISQQELMQAINDHNPPLILDVRTGEEFASGHIPGAIHVPHNEVGNWLRDINSRSKEIVIYCESGNRSRTAQQVLVNAGFDSVRHLEGDMKEWRDEGLPCEGCDEAQ